MYREEEIMRFVSLLVEVANPDKIILFGSYAYGEPNDRSDVDLLVIKNGKDFTIDEEAELATSVFLKKVENDIKMRYDLFFNTERQARNISENGGAFAEAFEKGKVIYARIQ